LTAWLGTSSPFSCNTFLCISMAQLYQGLALWYEIYWSQALDSSV
jgi:hypothetical protein